MAKTKTTNGSQAAEFLSIHLKLRAPLYDALIAAADEHGRSLTTHVAIVLANAIGRPDLKPVLTTNRRRALPQETPEAVLAEPTEAPEETNEVE